MHKYFKLGLISLIVLLFGLGFYSGNIRLEFGGIGKADLQKDYIANLAGLKDITGQIFITPFGSLDRWQAEISQTSGKLYMQTYDFTEKRIKAFLKTLLDRGVQVRLIMENKKFQQYVDTFKDIQKTFASYSGFAIKSDDQMGTKYVHSKIKIMDNKFIIQTANMTHSSFFVNREHFFVSYDTGVLASLNKIFEKDWKGEKITVQDIHPNLVICNLNCRIVIESLLKMASKSITIQTQYINDPAILEILKKQSKLKTQIIVSDTNASDYLVKYFGRAIVHKVKKPYIHTKMILIDDKILLLGSMNLSANSLDENREIGILLKDKSLIDVFLEQFSLDRELKK